MPARAAARRYSLLVCADTKSKVKESKETNNCRAAAAIDVVARAGRGRHGPGAAARRGAAAVDTRRRDAAADGRCRPRRPTPGAVHDDPHRGAAGRLAAAERALRVHRQRGRRPASSAGSTTRRSRPAPRRKCYPSILAGEHAFEVRARRDAVLAARPQGLADRVRGAGRRPDRRARGRARRPRPRPSDDGEMTLVSRHHRVPLQGRQPDPEGRRGRRDRAAAARRSCAARSCAATAARSTASA